MTIVLETKQLIFKLAVADDLDSLHALLSDADVMKYVGNGKTRSREEVKSWLDDIIAYQKKHGFSFYSVFEKATNEYVGRAGLIHLAFNEQQPDIEVGYTLHKKFWGKGYATEIAKALIQYGFNKLNLSKLVAVTYPENIQSRRVLEKAGMRYMKQSLYRGITVSLYEIRKNNIDFNDVKLIPATLNDLPVIQNLARFYAYDISEYYGDEPGWEMENDGLYGVGVDFKQYFGNPDCFPFLIHYKNELAGFAIIDKKGSEVSIDFNMAQFFVIRTYKGKGIGKYIAHQCFDQFRGAWEVMVMPGNEGAYRFWKSIIKDYTKNKFKEYTRTLVNGERNLFNFSSGANQVCII